MAQYSKILYLNKIDSLEDVLNQFKKLKNHNLQVFQNEVAEYKKFSKKRLKELLKSATEDEKEIIKKEQETTLEEDLKSCKKYYEEYENFNLLIDLSKIGKDKKSLNKIGQILKLFKEKNIIVDKVSFQLLDNDVDFRDRMPSVLKEDELIMLKYFEQSLVSKNLVDNIYLQEGVGGKPLTIQQVEKSNIFVEKISQKIKSMNLSPFEAAVYIHDFCSSFYYNETNYDSTRVLADVVNSGSIVCVGYASMYKAIVDKISMPGLNAKLNVATTNESAGGHANNLVEIKDDKYGINGTYMEDACWSAPGEFRSQNALTYCLYPIDDINNLEITYSYHNTKKMQEYYSLDTEFEKFDNMPNDERAAKNKIEHSEFLNSINKKGEPIDLNKYAEAYFKILIKRGHLKEEAKELVEEKINFSIALANIKFKKGCKNSFYKDVSKEFLEKYFSEEDIINKQILDLEKEIEKLEEDGSIDAFIAGMELRNKQNSLEEEKKEIRKEKEQKGLESNKNIISETLDL